MAKNKGKISKSYLLVDILFLLIATTFSYLSITYYYKLEDNTKKEKELFKELNNIQNENKKNNNNKNEVQIEIDKLNNIDKNIKKEKEDVFKQAKILEDKIIKNETNYKIAYITFDDGPYYNTNKVLDVLKKYKVKATFFTIGLDKETCYDNRSQSCSEMYKKEADAGHTIANHTYSHLIFRGLYSSVNAFIDQVKKQEQLIKEKTGITTNILRFPGGSGSAAAYGIKNGAIEKLKEMGYGWVDWTAGDGDGGSVNGTSDAWNRFTSSINENIEVVLFHDYSTVTLAILPQAIEYLQNKNYIILPLFYESVKVNK